MWRAEATPGSLSEVGTVPSVSPWSPTGGGASKAMAEERALPADHPMP